ncbi:MAG: FkbM family methyltransferase [Thermoproteota archaeon]|nr:FkbM family methyltransferase [Thermoproteota archaeon]
MKEIVHWIFKKPDGGVIPSFDRFALVFTKIFYLIVRVLFRVIFGKNKRNHSSFFQKLYVGASFSPSFLLTMYFYKIKKSLGLGGDKQLIQIKVPKYNYKVYCPPTKDDFINMTIREEDILEHFNPKKGETVVDVGAHIGRYTIISSNHVGNEGKVIAIEANPLVFEMLNKNVKLNQMTNVICINCAVFSEQTKINLFLPGETDGNNRDTIYNTIMKERARNEQKYVVVKANTLDNILREQGVGENSVNWIKIDVEGAELDVLKGAQNILSKSQRISLLVEIHNLGNGKNFYKPITDLLGAYNFKIEFEKTYESGERHVVFCK